MEPIIVLVHDMWHTPEHYRPYITALEKSLFQVYCPLLSTSDQSLPSSHRTPMYDLYLLSELVKSLVAAGKKVIMVMHGYGGMIGSNVPENLSIDYRAARGRRGGVMHLLYMSAYILPNGQSLVEYGLWDSPTSAEVVPGNSLQYFLDGLGPGEVSRCQPLFVRIPDLVFRVKIMQFAWKYIPCTYLFTRHNGAILRRCQVLMAQPLVGGARQYRGKMYDAGHSVYLSHTRAMVEEVQAISGVFWEQPLGGSSSSEGSEAAS
ncbi:hypothetical protein JMJ35_000187 [Cladonia borealis]|uniref:AB hydrolase-1 domain-containing protein n=1 Tax=Cladonia borealis TaxID=184061 RepID=A0AA39V5K8_9LECA|nr:hypothetical protein JMJ35_000187 [Cladonia borealis]